MKVEAHPWRLDPELETSLVHAARSQKRTVTALLEEIVRTWLEREADHERQHHLHVEARKCFGTLEGGDPLLAEQASGRVKRKLEAQRAANRSC